MLQHVEALEILLQGLCGVHKEHLRVHELYLKSGPNLGKLTFLPGVVLTNLKCLSKDVKTFSLSIIISSLLYSFLCIV
jgi:hypothetical protein